MQGSKISAMRLLALLHVLRMVDELNVTKENTILIHT